MLANEMYAEASDDAPHTGDATIGRLVRSQHSIEQFLTFLVLHLEDWEYSTRPHSFPFSTLILGMAGTARTIAVISVAALAILYQFVFKDLIFGTLGYGRTVQSIKDYPSYNCQRIEVPGLEACEDMWLHEDTGYLYMACSETKSRQSWCPPYVSLHV